MTFVIARITKTGLRVDSDSKLTDPNVIRTNPLSGAIKTILLDKGISVSYSGTVDYAQQAIEHLYSFKERLSDKEVSNELLEINKKSDFKTDFLVVSIRNSPRISKISNGQIELSNSSAWIGDYEAFRLFQESFIIKQNETLDLLKLQDTIFQEIVTSKKVESVGGFQITVHSTKLGLQYMIRSGIFIGRSQQFTIKAGEQVKLPFGTAQDGAYGTSYLVSENIDKPAIAIHFPHGNFGGLIYPRRSRSIEVIKNVDGRQFISIVSQLYGITLKGLIVENDGFRVI
jgi:hypothetical protein